MCYQQTLALVPIKCAFRHKLLFSFCAYTNTFEVNDLYVYSVQYHVHAAIIYYLQCHSIQTKVDNSHACKFSKYNYIMFLLTRNSLHLSRGFLL